VREPTLKKLLLSGVMAGLSLAVHASGAGALMITAFAWLFAPLPWRGPALRTRLGHGSVAVAAFVLAALFTGHAYMLKHGWTHASGAIGGEALEQTTHVNIGGVGYVFGVRWQSAVRLSKALVGYDPIVLVLGLAGIVLALRDR